MLPNVPRRPKTAAPPPVSDRSDTPEPSNPGRPVTRTGRAPNVEDYGRAWEAYRVRASLEDVVAAIAPQGFGMHTARSLVYVGLPALELPPLTTRLDGEAREAAASDRRLRREAERVSPAQAQALLAERTTALEAARKRTAMLRGDAATQMQEEAKLARANRLAVGALLSGMGELLQAVPALAKRVRRSMEDESLNLQAGLRAMKDIAFVTAKIAEASRAAVQTEHLVLGKPTTIIGTDDGAPEDMTPEEAELYIDLVVRAAERRAARRTSIDVEAVSVSDRSDTGQDPDHDADEAAE
jgi:hypothetical protein